MSIGQAWFSNIFAHFFDSLMLEREARNYSCEFASDGHTALHQLCASNASLTTVRGFLKSFKRSIDEVDRESGVTPLVTACKYGNLEIVKLLVERGANVNHRCTGLAKEEMKYDNVTPIYVATERRHWSIVEYLGTHGADVNVQMSPLGLTPVHRAVFLKDSRVLSVLIKQLKAKVGIPSVERPGAYPLYNAILTDDLSVLEIVLSAVDADPNVAEPTEHVTALHIAAYRGDTQAAEILIGKGANVNAQLKSGHSPLDLAIQEKNKHFAEFLRERGAVRKVLDKSWHPFIYCVVNGLQSMKTAVNRGADVNSILTSRGGCALHVCVIRRRMDACKFLLRKGADIEKKDVFGRTSLHIATDYDMINFVEFLLDRGANINAQTDSGLTPLHRAALKGSHSLCKLLIDRGANLELKARELGPPVIGAIHQGHTNIVKMLLKAGADPNATNPEDSIDRVTVLQIAVQWAADKPEIIKALIDAGADVRAPIFTHCGSLSYLHIVPLVTDSVESLTLMIEAGAYVDSQAIQTSYDPSASLCIHVNGACGDRCMPVSYSGPPLKCVRKRGRPALVRLLETTELLFKAVRKNDLSLAAKYLAQGGLVNCCSIRYDTPLIYASWKGFAQMVKFLLASGAKIDMPNVQNSSPLHYAARYNQKEVAIELLKAGASVDLVMCSKTPLELAKENNHSDVVAILEFTRKYLVESRSKKVTPLPDWKSDPKIVELASEFDGKISEKDIAALFGE